MQDIPECMQRIIAQAISHGIASGLRQKDKAPPKQSGDKGHRCSHSREAQGSLPSRPVSPSVASEVSFLGEEPQRDLDLSEDEESSKLDPPAFSGCFPPSLFKSLLRKARVMADLESSA